MFWLDEIVCCVMVLFIWKKIMEMGVLFDMYWCWEKVNYLFVVNELSIREEDRLDILVKEKNVFLIIFIYKYI